MEQFVSIYQEDQEQLDKHFDDLITSRFQRDPNRSLICRHWLERLPETGIKMLAQLALDRDTAKVLAQRTNLPVKTVNEHLQQMVDLGIAFKPAFPRGDRYALGEIFKDWFLEHTGGKVFLEEITSLQREAADRTAETGRTFTLLASIDPDMLLADGLYGWRVPLMNLQDAARNLERLSRRAEDIADLAFIGETLQTQLRQRDWEEVWKDYVRWMKEDGEKPTFVFRFTDEQLQELPVEMLQFDGNFLGRTAPVYKELFGADHEPAYRMSRGHFLTSTPLNVLLVASSAGGEHEGRRYSPLPRAEDELVEIIRILTGTAADAGLRVGKIVALTEGAAELPEQVERHPPTAVNFKQALRGELSNTQFHLLHYSGHYVHNDGDESAGLLFRGDREMNFVNLAELSNALDRRRLRLAFFNACKSGLRKSQRPAYNLGIAHTTLRCGVPVVIGMRWIIGDDEAYQISKAFYEELTKSGRPEVALWEARRSVWAREREGSILWAAPIMLTR
jgi:hypothetical protein